MSEILYKHARRQLEPGDVLLWRGTGFFSSVIRWRTGSEYSHASLVDVDRGRVWIVESREGRGLQHVPLSNVLLRNPSIAWFRHVAPESSSTTLGRLDRDAAVQYAIERVGAPEAGEYDYAAIVRIWRTLWPWARQLSAVDGASLPRGAICSALVAAACRAGGRDLVPFREDRVTTPGDLARTGLLVYRGDLVLGKAAA